jgi:hypothetical protein
VGIGVPILTGTGIIFIISAKNIHTFRKEEENANL